MALSAEVLRRRENLRLHREALIAKGIDPDKPLVIDEEESPNLGPRKKAAPSETDDLIGELANLARKGGWTANNGNLTKDQIVQAALLTAIEVATNHPEVFQAAVPEPKKRGRAAAK